MRVSVVLPCYNHARYVERCLRSIDAQEWEDLEVLIIDDGSTDATWDVISRFRWQPHRRVRAMKTENRGAHAALNFGLSLATGEFVAPCNSDDAFSPARLARMVRAARQHEARFLFSGVTCVDDDDRDITHQWPYATSLFQKQDEIRTYPSTGFALMLTNVAISTGNFFFDRSLVSELGYFRPYRYCHDWDFILRALLVTEPVYVPDPLYFYRLHPNNSFLALQEAAAFECPQLMRRFMKAAAEGRTPNGLAPSPHNWPGFFEYFVEEHRYQPYQQEWDAVDGPRHDPEAAELNPRILAEQVFGKAA